SSDRPRGGSARARAARASRITLPAPAPEPRRAPAPAPLAAGTQAGMLFKPRLAFALADRSRDPRQRFCTRAMPWWRPSVGVAQVLDAAVDLGAQQITLVADEAAVVAQAHLAAPARFDCLLGIERREPGADVVGVSGRRGWHRGGRLRALLRPHRSLPARFLPWLLGLLCLGSRTNGFLRLRGLLGSLLRLRLDCGP